MDAKAGDDFNANTWPAFLHCLTETGDTGNLDKDTEEQLKACLLYTSRCV